MSESPTHARSWSLRDLLEGYVTAPHPPTPGAVAMIVVDGTVVEAACAGERVRYADRAGRLLPDSAREPMHPDDLFDLASVTKLFATITLLRLVDAGVVDLDGPLQAVLPSYAHGDKRQVTLRHLLTHTSGLPSITRLWDVPGGRDDRITALLDIPLEATPGARFAYSCVGYMTAMALAETVTGTRFDALVADHVTTPLGLAETLYNPLDHGIDVSRCAATEFDEEYRGRLVRGEVHDENAFSLDGVSANAGLFATAADLARFGEAVRTNGAADVPSLLEPATHTAMFSDQLSASLDPGFRHGLGWRIGDVNTTGPLAGHEAFSHSGFTGTSLTIHPGSGLTVVVLTNRVHPSRDWSEIGGLRQSVVTYALGLAAARGPVAAMSTASARTEPTPTPGRPTARLLVRDQRGRVLLLHGHNITDPDTTFWYTPGRRPRIRARTHAPPPCANCARRPGSASSRTPSSGPCTTTWPSSCSTANSASSSRSTTSSTSPTSPRRRKGSTNSSMPAPSGSNGGRRATTDISTATRCGRSTSPRSWSTWTVRTPPHAADQNFIAPAARSAMKLRAPMTNTTSNGIVAISAPAMTAA